MQAMTLDQKVGLKDQRPMVKFPISKECHLYITITIIIIIIIILIFWFCNANEVVIIHEII
jgi:uncharacterized membrane protein YvbJ